MFVRHISSAFNLQMIFASRSYARYTKKGLRSHSKPDAGIKKQFELLKDNDRYLDDPEGFGNYETDFTSLHKLHKHHESEMEANEERIKYLIVKNKYFKSNEKENFLTWAEKEQIRFLHKDDPELWTVEKLVESFPATDEIIIKILKAKWTPRDMKRIKKHDESVKRTWELYKSNQLHEIDPSFVEHLKKFSHRSFDSGTNAYTQSKTDQIKFCFPVPKTKEFSQLITSCKAYKKTPIHAPKKIVSPHIANQAVIESGVDKFEVKATNNKRHMTYDQLPQSKSLNDKKVEMESIRIEKGEQQFSEIEKIDKSLDVQKDLVKNTLEMEKTPPPPPPPVKVRLNALQQHSISQNPSGTGIVVDLPETNLFNSLSKISKYETKTVSMKKNDDSLTTSEIRDRVVIPKRLFKKGATYKLYDCFYDDDGEFLYRVPGMTG